jgi:sugar O-acyltransferase (sialic acid O-acetyltransferase NeuD family)
MILLSTTMNDIAFPEDGVIRVAILGAGALGQQIAQHLYQASGYIVVGYFDDTQPKGKVIAGGRVMGTIAEATEAYRYGTFDALLMGIGYQHLAVRQQLFEELSEVISFASFVHKTAHVDTSVVLEPGCFISPGCILDLNTQLGPNTFLYPGCILAHDTVVTGHSFFGPGVKLAGHVSIAESCFLGIGTTVIDNLTIGRGIQTGGGAVVIKSLSQPGLYVGNPARFIR